MEHILLKKNPVKPLKILTNTVEIERIIWFA